MICSHICSHWEDSREWSLRSWDETMNRQHSDEIWALLRRKIHHSSVVALSKTHEDESLLLQRPVSCLSAVCQTILWTFFMVSSCFAMLYLISWNFSLYCHTTCNIEWSQLSCTKNKENPSYRKSLNLIRYRNDLKSSWKFWSTSLIWYVIVLIKWIVEWMKALENASRQRCVRETWDCEFKYSRPSIYFPPSRL